MDSNSIYTVLITAITVLGSTRAWRYYERKALLKEKAENFMKDNCAERISKLEALLEKASKEKDEMRNTILNLTAQVAELRVKVQYLEDENEYLNAFVEKKKSEE
jgi:peptidoglycan hydrolase CwlO-like protein